MVVAALVFLSVFVTYLLAPKEPTYRGKSLRAWIGDLKEDSRSSASRAQAEEAIRATGIGALPFLEQMLSAQPGPKERLVDFLQNQPWIEVTHLSFNFTTADEVHMQALIACKVLGTNAIPVLEAGLRSTDMRVRRPAAECLVRTYVNSKNSKGQILALVGLLSDQDEVICVMAADALGDIGPAAIEAVGTLTGLLKSTRDDFTRWRIALALDAIDPLAKPSIPGLIGILEIGQETFGKPFKKPPTVRAP